MKFRVKALRRAETDVRSIAHYIFAHSPQGADAWLESYRDAISRLAENADSCGEAYENSYFEIEVKQSFFKTPHGRVYRLLFTVVGDEAKILRVRGPGQAPVTPEDT